MTGSGQRICVPLRCIPFSVCSGTPQLMRIVGNRSCTTSGSVVFMFCRSYDKQLKHLPDSGIVGQCLLQPNHWSNIPRKRSNLCRYLPKTDFHTTFRTLENQGSIEWPYISSRPAVCCIESQSSVLQRLQGVHQQSSGNDSMTPVQKLKLAIKVYGGTVVVFHVVISLASLACCYLAVTSGLDVERMLTALNLSSSKVATAGGGFVLAYAVHKLLAPIRIAVTLSCTPFLVRYFRRVGILKDPGKK